MHFRSTIVLLLPFFILAGCGRPAGESQKLPKFGTAASALLDHADPEFRNKHQRKHYFLVAGASDAANYAHEIVQQKRYLKSQGVPSEDIACFYAMPTDKVFQQEKERLQALAPDLADCYPAYARYVYDVIQDGVQSTTPIYFYVSSHGAPPFSTLEKTEPNAQGKADLAEWRRAIPELDQFMALLQSNSRGASVTLREQAQSLYDGAEKATDVLLTPSYLRKALYAATAAGVERRVVVQACYSGGFIDGESGSGGLRDADTTIMTASRSDRSSFGCGVGPERTFFGGAFNDALFATRQLPTTVDFSSLYREVETSVGRLEREYLDSLSSDARTKFLSSAPQFAPRSRLSPR